MLGVGIKLAARRARARPLRDAAARPPRASARPASAQSRCEPLSRPAGLCCDASLYSQKPCVPPRVSATRAAGPATQRPAHLRSALTVHAARSRAGTHESAQVQDDDHHHDVPDERHLPRHGLRRHCGGEARRCCEQTRLAAKRHACAAGDPSAAAAARRAHTGAERTRCDACAELPTERARLASTGGATTSPKLYRATGRPLRRARSGSHGRPGRRVGKLLRERGGDAAEHGAPPIVNLAPALPR